MDITALILSIFPEQYRRDITVAILSAVVTVSGLGLWHEFTTIAAEAATAQSTAEKAKQLDQRMIALTNRLPTIEGQTATAQSNSIAAKQEIDELYTRITGKAPLPTAPAVPSLPPTTGATSQ